LLGKLENNHKRYGVNLDAFLGGLQQYIELHKTNQTGLLHPTHRTLDEKKVLARKRRKRATVKRRLLRT
jgi:hypothetical protein